MDGPATTTRTIRNADAATNGNVRSIANAGGIASIVGATRKQAARASPPRIASP